MTQLPTTSLHHPAESELFDETLSCELALPAEFQAGSAAGRTSSAEGLLRSLALVEDSRVDEHDDRNESSLQLQRLEAKLDLAMVLLGRLVRQQGQELTLRPVRWSRWRAGCNCLAAGRGIRCGAAGWRRRLRRRR